MRLRFGYGSGAGFEVFFSVTPTPSFVGQVSSWTLDDEATSFLCLISYIWLVVNSNIFLCSSLFGEMIPNLTGAYFSNGQPAYIFSFSCMSLVSMVSWFPWGHLSGSNPDKLRCQGKTFERKGFFYYYHTPSMYVWYIYLHLPIFTYMNRGFVYGFHAGTIHVGKYTSPMDALGYDIYSFFLRYDAKQRGSGAFLSIHFNFPPPLYHFKRGVHHCQPKVNWDAKKV